MANYVKIEVPKELVDKELEIISKAKKGGKIKIGSNQVTKAIERGQAKLVLVAEDVNPPEIVMHLPLLCKEKEIPVGFVPTRKELGEAAGIEISTSSIAIVEAGDAEKTLADVVKKLKDLE